MNQWTIVLIGLLVVGLGVVFVSMGLSKKPHTKEDPYLAFATEDAARKNIGRPFSLVQTYDGDESYGRFNVSVDGRSLVVSAPTQDVDEELQTGVVLLYRCESGVSTCSQRDAVPFRIKGSAHQYGRTLSLSDDGLVAGVAGPELFEVYRRRVLDEPWHRVSSIAYDGVSASLNRTGDTLVITKGPSEIEIHKTLMGGTRYKKYARLNGFQAPIVSTWALGDGNRVLVSSPKALFMASALDEDSRRLLVEGRIESVVEHHQTDEVYLGEPSHDDFNGRVIRLNKDMKVAQILEPGIDQINKRGRFGHSISMANHVLCIGSPRTNKVYVYEHVTKNSEPVYVMESPNAEKTASWHRFGEDVHMVGPDTLCVSCNTQDTNRLESGAIYVYER